ncbi:hypothetical protein [Ammoniphilus sp. YIM 78166]|uniref:hypothetical protein n=1 Tax=Ammoniphilus sp. YIM 78166 TaxID=1644106 RepID=UPI00106F3C9C|nr:hypothetical protein [Ammoniphilus sp. YIM 78166]
MSFVHFDEIFEVCCEANEQMHNEYTNRRGALLSDDWKNGVQETVRKRKKIVFSTVPNSKALAYNP